MRVQCIPAYRCSRREYLFHDTNLTLIFVSRFRRSAFPAKNNAPAFNSLPFIITYSKPPAVTKHITIKPRNPNTRISSIAEIGRLPYVLKPRHILNRDLRMKISQTITSVNQYVMLVVRCWVLCNS